MEGDEEMRLPRVRMNICDVTIKKVATATCFIVLRVCWCEKYVSYFFSNPFELPLHKVQWIGHFQQSKDTPSTVTHSAVNCLNHMIFNSVEMQKDLQKVWIDYFLSKAEQQKLRLSIVKRLATYRNSICHA